MKLHYNIKERSHQIKNNIRHIPAERRLYAKLIYCLMMALICMAMYAGAADYFHDNTLNFLLFVAFTVFSIFAPLAGGYLADWIEARMGFAILILFPLLMFYVTEACMDTGCDLKTLSRVRFVGNYILYALIIGLFYVLFHSVRWGVLGETIVFFIFGMGNAYVIRFRQIPVLAGDLSTMGTAMNVADAYEYSLSGGQVLMTSLLLAVITYFIFFAPGREMREKLRLPLYLRLGLLCCYLAVFGTACYGIAYTDFLKDHHISINTFMPIKTYASTGGALDFARSIRNMIIDKPGGYSATALDALQDKYPSDEAVGDDDREYRRPNVIVMMNEAFCDLQQVGDFETNEDVMPFYHSLKENAVKGQTYVSVFGGQTANSEYEFLTGDSKAFIPEGTTPYQLYIKKYMPTMTANLLLDDYGCALAMHPYKASGYNRQNVYPYFGFQRFITEPDYAKDAKRVGLHISDEADVDRIIEEYEKNKKETGKPYYMFNVTMQNHSPYDREWPNLSYDIEITRPKIKDHGAHSYLNLIRESDRALKKLVEYFDKTDDDTVIVFYGDHEPGLSDSFYEKILGKSRESLKGREALNLYHTPYLIWANYDIEEKEDYDISMNYMQSVMLDECGLKKCGYDKFLLDLRKDVPIINISGYIGADDRFYRIDDEKSPYYERINDYHILSYNHLFGGRDRRDEIFELKHK